MNLLSRNIFPALSLACLILAGMAGCKKQEEELALERMFMPTGDIAITTDDTSAMLTWDAALFTRGQVISYTVELSQDTLFQSAGQTFTTDTSGITITQEHLAPREKYFIRVKTNGANGTPESKWLTSNGFSITGEQLFLPLESTDIIDKAVILKWEATPGLTKIVITPAGGTSLTIPLTAAESTGGQKMISALTPSTQYTAELFKEEQSKGYLEFSTKASLSGDHIVDLSGITGRPSVLADTLPALAAGSIVVLKRGETYEVSSELVVSNGVSIISENSFDPALPVIYFSSNMNIATGSNIDSLVFRELTLRGSSFSSKYVMNINKAGAIGNISFESCHIEIFRGVVRLQTSAVGGTQVNSVNINNCVIDSISNYGVINVDNAACAVQHIAVQNSTIYKAEKVLVSKQQSTSVVLDACTIHEAPQGGGSNYLVDYNANQVVNGISVINCILGTGRNNNGNLTVRGIRAGASTQVSSGNSYHTADYEAVSHAIPGLIPYDGTAAGLFLAPAQGDFTITDNSFAGRSTAGDPRWRP
ncbi:DUF5123 domain-containing protein [Chitinophaga japonensis]|uniref:Fibronectin type III domain protein n=1 Tax=Chitinophaga japonensis TaxID=104662 RepID=A0A562T4R4_CHIJA|nr:DUF5123 domain-containing protein [Chitinophaga japonensis]TWI88525.1 fibronectin type III domain protein [Chitinophaga japonensis]